MFRRFHHVHRATLSAPTLREKAAEYAATLRALDKANTALLTRLEPRPPKLRLVVRTDGVYFPVAYVELYGDDLRTVHFGPWPSVPAAWRAIREGPLSRHGARYA